MLQTFPKSETKRDVCHVGGKVPPLPPFFSLYCVVNRNYHLNLTIGYGFPRHQLSLRQSRNHLDT